MRAMAWLLAALLALPLGAQAADSHTPFFKAATGGLPDFQACELSYTFTTTLNVYQQTTPTGPAIKLGTATPLTSAPVVFTFPCPTAQGTYYWSLTEVNSAGVEGPRGANVGFTLK